MLQNDLNNKSYINNEQSLSNITYIFKISGNLLGINYKSFQGSDILCAVCER